MTRKRQDISRSTNIHAVPDGKMGSEARPGHSRTNGLLKKWARKKRRQRDRFEEFE